MTKTKEEQYLGYNLFTHIKDKKVRDWNRLHTYASIIGTKGMKMANEYLTECGDSGKRAVRDLFKEIESRGLDAVRQEVRGIKGS